METSRRLKIIRLCRTTCTACILLLPLFVVCRLLLVFYGRIEPSVSSHISAMRQVLFYVISLIRYGAFLYGLILLRRQFDLYEKGEFFTAKNVACFRGIGWALVVAVVMQLDLGLVLIDTPGSSYGLSYSISHEKMGLFTAFGSLISSSFSLMPGLLLLLISWTMDEGRLLKEEQDLFI